MMYRSSKSSRNLATTPSRLRISMDTSIAGWRLQNAPIRRGMKYFAVLTTATRRRPRVKPLAPSTTCSKALHWLAMALAVLASSTPMSVSCTLRETTSYKGSPTASVSSRSCIDAVGWVTWVARAAAVTLPVSASARNSLSCRNVAFIEKILCDHHYKLISLHVFESVAFGESRCSRHCVFWPKHK